MPLKPGDKAPAISLLDQHGTTVKLSSFKGRMGPNCESWVFEL